jgi:hypothetical protein
VLEAMFQENQSRENFAQNAGRLQEGTSPGRYEERDELFERAVIFRFKRGFLI